MKSILCILLVSACSMLFSQTGESSSVPGSTNFLEIICSPDKDTLFIVNGPTAALILEVWDKPQTDGMAKPVFIFVTIEEINRMALLPRYARKKNY